MDTYTGRSGTTDSHGQVTFTLPQGSYRFRADYNGVQFWSGDQNTCTIPGCKTAAVTLPGGRGGETSVTINYTYDPLYRLTAADYSDGEYFHYTYDAMGNRLTQDSTILGLPTSTSYTYDNANRLTSVAGVPYTWDANGNLLKDGTNTYTYDSANQLTAVSGQQSTVGYSYNGLGDRLQETVNGQTSQFTLDLASGLTQVLDDNTYIYLYGNGLISQAKGSDTEYPLDDSIRSVRQITDANGTVTPTQNYDPYGDIVSNLGNSTSAFGFSGEYTDPDGLLYLRARYYAIKQGR